MNRTEHREEKWIFPFVEYSCDIKNKKLPLIVQLHGAGERGWGKEDLEKVDVHGFSKYLKDAEHDCIVIMPQCPVDEERMYLTGLSMGGYGTWYTSMARPDLFAAIAPICGGGMAWNAGVLKMPIWAFHGADDAVVSVTQSDEMVCKLKELDADIIYTRIDEVGHNVWEYAYNKDLLEWLLSKKRCH